MVAKPYCIIRKGLPEQHAICTLHCTMCFMLHPHACCFMRLHVRVHLIPWDICYCLYIRQSQTLLQTRQVPSAAERSICCLYDCHNCGLARHEYYVISTINSAVSVQSNTRQQATQYTSRHTWALWPKEFFSKP